MGEQASSINKVRSLVAGHAQAFLDELLGTGETPCSESVVLANGGWTVFLSVCATPAGCLPGLSETDRDCLILLAQVQEPLSATRVLRELERRNRAVYAEITVKRSLTKLKRLGLVSNNRKGSRGYWLSSNLPLFRRDSNG